MKAPVFLGIDTSNYTTSFALAREGKVIANLKAPLPVKEGECGLRQSDALFAHVKNMPLLSARLREALEGETPAAVGVSERPRNLDGSYMPCFLGGVSAAETVSAALGVPLYRFSHQCGHLRAALYSAGMDRLCGTAFGAFHVSGGTTEVLHVTPREDGFTVSLIGGTQDLNAGQAIDRVGVAMGLSFPCGIAMEALANEFNGKTENAPISVKDGNCNLSGFENKALKLFEKRGDRAEVAAFVFESVCRTLSAMGEQITKKYGDMPILFAGGVMSNRYMRSALSKKFDAYFSEPAFSADNAAGISLLCRKEFLSE